MCVYSYICRANIGLDPSFVKTLRFMYFCTLPLIGVEYFCHQEFSGWASAAKSEK